MDYNILILASLDKKVRLRERSDFVTMEHNSGNSKQEDGSHAEIEEEDGNYENSRIQPKDSFDLETGGSDIHGLNSRQATDWRTIMKLAFQCIGVVYGDLGTSPLYVLPGIFQDGIKHDDDLLGVLSLILYAIVFIALIKYVFIVLAANDNGDGGTFALYSLLCRYAKINLIPNQQVEDRNLSNYKLDTPNRRVKRASAIKSLLENSYFMKYFILFTTMHDPNVIKAVNPWYIVLYFKRDPKGAWISLGGAEALFADLGHFNIRSIQISSCSLVIPSIICAYFGQCSYLRQHPEDSLISASFSIVQQAVALGCFPRVKVVHTSSEYEGQVYVPEVNTLLMVACVGVTLGFKNTLTIGNAYGIAVAFVFNITSAFLILVMVMIWKTHIIFIILYVSTIGVFEVSFLSSVLYKFVDGGYLPLLFAFLMVIIMFTWNFGYRKKYFYELKNKVSIERVTNIASDPSIQRVQGLGIFYTQLVQGISPIFTHYVENIPALHSVLLFVSIKSVPISRVPATERFLFRRVKSPGLIFQCVVRYGYRDSTQDPDLFEVTLVNQLKQFMEDESGKEEAGNELALIDNELRNGGIVYLLGESEVTAMEGSSFPKKLTVDYLYNWLSRCVRQPTEVFSIPRRHLLKVGMTYEKYDGKEDASHDEEKQNNGNFAGKRQRKVSFDLEDGGDKLHGHNTPQARDWGIILKLAFQCIGVVYGDIGGTFALYSLICRHAKINLIPNQQEEDRKLSNYNLNTPSGPARRASAIKSFLENSQLMKYSILFTTMLVLHSCALYYMCLFWPMFLSPAPSRRCWTSILQVHSEQSLISASFSVVQQAVALGCFPRVKVVHTSAEYKGQTHIIVIILYVLIISVIEVGFLSSVLYKFVDGGYLPLLCAFIMVIIMFTWSYGYRKKYIYELKNKVTVDRVTAIASDPSIQRVKGLGVFFTQLVQGISPIFTHYVDNIPALHTVLLFVSIKYVPVSRVPAEERFLFRRVNSPGMIFQCAVRYGYCDSQEDNGVFEETLVNQLKQFVGEDTAKEMTEKELSVIDHELKEGGIVYLLGENEVTATEGSSFPKKLIVDYLYDWLSRCVRQPSEVFFIPRKRLLKVGMTYEV
ncbi:hypothetical protein Tsubulata_037450, partial [Turnera subulata]